MRLLAKIIGFFHTISDIPIQAPLQLDQQAAQLEVQLQAAPQLDPRAAQGAQVVPLNQQQLVLRNQVRQTPALIAPNHRCVVPLTSLFALTS